MNDIKEKLNKYITKEILNEKGRTLGSDESLIKSGLIDSFSLMDLGLFVEDNFGVRIEDTELNAETFDTLSQLEQLILSRR